LPDRDTIQSGVYRPLSRPLFLYVNKASLDRPEVRAFLEFYIDNAHKIVEHPNVNYVALSDDVYRLVRQRLDHRVTGSIMVHQPAGEPADLEKLLIKTARPGD